MMKKVKEILSTYEYEIDFYIRKDKVVFLKGEVNEWQEVVDIGHEVAAVKGVRNIVNDITSKGITVKNEDNKELIQEALRSDVTECDVLIIGGGVSGCAIAHAFGKYDLKTIVLEKNSDIGTEATKANNGNIHPGLLAKYGTLKAKLNLKGNKMYTEWAKDLDFELQRPGSLVVFYEEKHKKQFDMMRVLKRTGLGYFIKPAKQMMRTPGLKWLSAKEVKEMEPNIKGSPIGGFWMTTMGLVEPFEVVYALSENAIDNGVEFKMDTKVLAIQTEGNIHKVITNNGIFKTKTIINAAGVYADKIAEMVDDKFYTIHARRGAIAILDKSRKGFINRPAGIMKSGGNKNSKGGGASLTPEGNFLWGPTAKEVYDREDKSVEAADMEYILALGQSVTDEVKKNEIIQFFAGIRAADYREDFIIEKSRTVNGFIHVAGIQSPGLAAAPAVAEMVEKIYKKDHRLKVKENYIKTRKRTPIFRELSHEAQDKLIQQNPKYGRIICRCEMITEGEILDAIHAPIPATSLDAVKRRSRAGMGRCQSGFCGSKVLEIIARELDVPMTEVTLKGKDSKILERENR